MNTKKTTTKRRKQSNQSLLKTFLVIGSVLATFFGGEILARQSIVEPTPIVVMGQNSAETRLSDSPIPQLEIPNPITRSKSSK